MIDGELLRDHAADRPSRDVRTVDVERVEDREGVVGHVGDSIRHLRLESVLHRLEHREEIRQDQVELRRESHVAVVEADDEEAPRDEQFAELDIEVDALASQPVDEEQCRVRRIAERLVVDLDRAVVREGHRAFPCPFE